MTVMFCATRNLYEYVPGIIYNLLDKNPTVKRIYLFIEDDRFPYLLDERVITINVKNFCYKYVREDSPNVNCGWTYMSFVRCYVSRIIPEDKIIYLDLDLIFHGYLELLWNIDFEGNYVCGVKEKDLNVPPVPGFPMGNPYLNTGVLLMNLKALRETGADLKLCWLLNTYNLRYPDQDAINAICRGHIKFISPSFNNSPVADGDAKFIPIAITHCIRRKPWKKDSPYYNYWKENTEKALGIRL